MNFSLICTCGHVFSGYFTDEDYVFEYYCGCGKHWIIPKPHDDKEDAPTK